MNQRAKQAVMSVVFIGLLALIAVRGGFWSGLSGQQSSSEAGMSEQEVLHRYGFRFTEVSKSVGVDFVHQSPTLDAQLNHIMPIVAGMGAGASVIDFNGDGWLDIYVVTGKEGGKNRLYRNRKDGSFEEVAEAMGVADVNRPGTGVSMGAIWADFDNDGFPDLFIYKWGRPELYRNQEGRGFERVEDAGLPAWVNANSACWLDYDGDGLVDLFIAGYWPEDLNLWKLETTKIMPTSFEYAKNGGRKYLLRNLGHGRFEDVTAKVGIQSTRWTLAVAAADLCGTGYPDLVLANDYGVPEFYANKGGERFEEVAGKINIGLQPKSGMNVCFGDILNRGRLGIYISNISEPAVLVQGNFLFMPTGTTADGLPSYTDQAAVMNVDRGGWSWGAKFGDLNNDGRLDLYLATGYVSADPGKSYWYDYGKIAGGLKGLIADARLWPPIGDQSLAGYQRKCVWMNKGGDFTDIATVIGVTDLHDGRSVVLADLFNRGWLDALVANQNGPLLLYKNTVSAGQDWIEFDLEGGARPGSEKGWSNRSAVGAEVRVFWKNHEDGRSQQQVQVVTAGDGYASQGMLRLHFGLGKNAQVEKAVIQWPSRRSQTMERPGVNICHKVRERGS